MDKLKSRGVKGLRWLEQYTKTDMVYLAKGGFWLGIGQVASSGSAFLTSLVFANLLAPELFGIYKYVISIMGLLAITTLTGMDSAVTQSIARGYDGTLEPAIKSKIKWGTIGTVLSFIIAVYYYTQGNLILSVSFCVVALFMPFYEAFDLYNAFLFGKKLFDTQTRYNIARKIIALVSTVITLFLTSNLYIILFVFFVSFIIPNIFLLYKTIKNHKKNDTVDPEAITYGKSLSMIGIVGMVLGQLDKVLIFHYLGAVNLAVYSLAVAPADQIKGLLKNVNALAMPQFSNRTPEEIKKTIWHKVWILGLIIGSIVLGYILIAPIFFNIFFPKYLASIHYSQILSLSLIPVVIAGFIYTALESQKDKVGIYKYNLYTNIFSIIILLPLVYYFGIWGAIVSRLSSRLFSFILASTLIKKIS